jgi:UDP-N-acetylmuramoyl-L-alanyl-D-glutamate--2,6-diaminopimelate ligase
VLVDYAHSPDGLANIINAVRDFTTGRVITLFGCGGDRDAAKRPIMGRVAGELSDYCIVTSDNPRSEAPDEIIRQIVAGLSETSCPFETLPDRRAAIFRGAAIISAGDALIIAGKGHERTQIIGGDVLPFDDVEVAREALSE